MTIENLSIVVVVLVVVHIAVLVVVVIVLSLSIQHKTYIRTGAPAAQLSDHCTW